MVYQASYEAGRLVLRGARVTLREHTPEDAAAVADGESAGLEWIDGRPGEDSVGAATMTVRAMIAGHLGSPWGIFAVLRSSDGTALGSIGFHGPPSAPDGEVEIGYDLSPSARGAGWATDAVRVLVAWALARPEVHTVIATTDPANAPSQGVLTRAGFTRAPARGDLYAYRRDAAPVADPSSTDA
ncbi:GNAT family N-acetyltransferase [Streptomyces sp. NPDC048636]|uniref:GNAT family N-acetyltransferase n=1 Tax=Streptomyces sp. NPDC048636 TaxID=3155762 RepID=UPI00343CF00D